MKQFEAEFHHASYTPGDFPKDQFNQIAFAGRSNVGKSSMINCLISQKNLARISSHPGKTRSINFLLINRRFFFVDLPGYGYAKISKAERQRWKTLIESYLMDNSKLKGLIHIIDSRVGLTNLDEGMLTFASEIHLNTVIVATKIDKLKQSEKVKNFRLIEKKLAEFGLSEYIPFSAKTKFGRKEVLHWIENSLKL
ncbi:YihA family ribosome biogenesis GTP-binding protein [candidate division KSB1 bacterium]|nr:YihA family ribosome biogenesis GTP-binding protein [candidate division KSB1 bacterium]